MSLNRICDVIRRDVGLRCAFTKRLFATESKDEFIDISAADEQPIFPKEDITVNRNKSRLNPEHRNMLMGIRPFDSPHEWFHKTVKYKKRTLGKYGLNAVDEPAGFLWPTPEQIKIIQEYESVRFPQSLQERWEKLEQQRQEEAAAIKQREIEIIEKLSKMNQWTSELQAKVAKKKAELEKAKLRKERLVEEVRRHFGFNVSPNDAKFKEMLEQKEKEEKKKKKEAKKQAKIDRMKSMIQNQITQSTTQEQKTDSTKPTE